MAGRKISHVQGKGSIAHNNRTFHPKNADLDRKKDNVTLVKEPIGAAYDRIFGAAVAEYDEKQKRADRRVGNYYEYLFNRKPSNEVLTSANKQKSFYEDLIQLGDMEDTPCGSPEAEEAKQCLVEYMDGWDERNPNFKVFNSVIHMDEATPHLHNDFIPVCHCKRGLSLQNGLAKALEEMGFGTGPNAISRWREREREVFAEICRSHGFEIEAAAPGRGHSFTVDEYKEIQDKKKELQAEVDQLEAKIPQIAELTKAEAQKAVEDLGGQILEEIAEKADVYTSALAYISSCSDDEFNRISREGSEAIRDTALDSAGGEVERLIELATKASTGKLSEADRSELMKEYAVRRDECVTWLGITAKNLAEAKRIAYADLAAARRAVREQEALLRQTRNPILLLFFFIRMFIDSLREEALEAEFKKAQQKYEDYVALRKELEAAEASSVLDLSSLSRSAEQTVASMKNFVAHADRTINKIRTIQPPTRIGFDDPTL